MARTPSSRQGNEKFTWPTQTTGMNFYDTERGKLLLQFKRQIRCHSFYKGDFVWREDHWEYRLR